MDEERLPNRLLFGELNMKRPGHGAKKRWRDVLKVDWQAIGVHDRWYELCQDRKGWFHLRLDGVEKISTSLTQILMLIQHLAFYEKLKLKIEYIAA